MKTAFKLDLKEARAMVRAALEKAEELRVPETVCVCDDGGYPIALERADGARITGPQIAWNKAFTAAGHRRSTHLFNQAPGGPALPGNEAFGIQWSFEGKFAVFVGGFPVVVNGEVVGGVGLIVEFHHREHRPEDLLARDAHLGAYAVEDRRSYEVASREHGLCRSVAAVDEARAFRDADAHVLENAVALFA